MDYDYIEVEKEGKYIKFYFVLDGVKREFYNFSVKNEKDVRKWDEHLKNKNWYIGDVKDKTRSLMLEMLRG